MGLMGHGDWSSRTDQIEAVAGRELTVRQSLPSHSTEHSSNSPHK